MAKILSPIRIARSRRTSFQDTAETQELDFALGLGMGLHIHAVEFGMRSAIFVPPADDTLANAAAHLSLHAEVGGLEGAIDAFPADETILNSEIIAETTLNARAFSSSVPAASPDVATYQWMQPLSWNFNQLIGGPLVLAQNLTFRGVASAATFTINGAQVTIFYQYVRLTTAELAGQFSLRR